MLLQLVPTLKLPGKQFDSFCECDECIPGDEVADNICTEITIAMRPGEVCAFEPSLVERPLPGTVLVTRLA